MRSQVRGTDHTVTTEEDPVAFTECTAIDAIVAAKQKPCILGQIDGEGKNESGERVRERRERRVRHELRTCKRLSAGAHAEEPAAAGGCEIFPNKKIRNLQFKKLSKEEWSQLNDFKSLTSMIKKNCPFIKYSTNLTNDVFYRIILKKKFDLLNFIPFGPRNTFITEMYKSFDNDYYLKLNKEIYNQNVIIAVDNTLVLNIDFKDNQDLYLFKNIKYNNYGANFINIYLPKNCKI